MDVALDRDIPYLSVKLHVMIYDKADRFGIEELKIFNLARFQIYFASGRLFLQDPNQVRHLYARGYGWGVLPVVQMIYQIDSRDDRRLHDIVLAAVRFDMQRFSASARPFIERLRRVIPNLDREFSTCALDWQEHRCADARCIELFAQPTGIRLLGMDDPLRPIGVPGQLCHQKSWPGESYQGESYPGEEVQWPEMDIPVTKSCPIKRSPTISSADGTILAQLPWRKPNRRVAFRFFTELAISFHVHLGNQYSQIVGVLTGFALSC